MLSLIYVIQMTSVKNYNISYASHLSLHLYYTEEKLHNQIITVYALEINKLLINTCTTICNLSSLRVCVESFHYKFQFEQTIEWKSDSPIYLKWATKFALLVTSFPDSQNLGIKFNGIKVWRNYVYFVSGTLEIR